MSQSISDLVIRNPGHNTPFSSILHTRMSRRTVMHGGLASALTLLAGCGSGSSLPESDSDSNPEDTLVLGFASLPASMTDACVVPPGYTATVLGAWGSPLNDQAAPWQRDGSNSAHDLLHTTGMHHDGMHYFALDGSSSEGLKKCARKSTRTGSASCTCASLARIGKLCKIRATTGGLRRQAP